MAQAFAQHPPFKHQVRQRRALQGRGRAACRGRSAQGAFSRIARAVEISLFGGRSIDAGAWQQCRSAYAELTVPKNWARA